MEKINTGFRELDNLLERTKGKGYPANSILGLNGFVRIDKSTWRDLANADGKIELTTIVSAMGLPRMLTPNIREIIVQAIQACLKEGLSVVHSCIEHGDVEWEDIFKQSLVIDTEEKVSDESTEEQSMELNKAFEVLQ